MHLIKITHSKPAETLPFDIIKAQVILDLQKQNAKVDFQKYMFELALKYPATIQIDDFSISSTIPDENFTIETKP